MFIQIFFRSGFKVTESDDGLSDDEKDSNEEDKCVAAIVWNKQKYKGTPLKQDDKRLGKYVRWLKVDSV